MAAKNEIMIIISKCNTGTRNKRFGDQSEGREEMTVRGF